MSINLVPFKRHKKSLFCNVADKRKKEIKDIDNGQKGEQDIRWNNLQKIRKEAIKVERS